ncbi:MAG: oligosaccharide flippase family protein [Peptoniphilaceae bacterium]|nr:oligosaccharide flippase family protein [Peptoniphilaceae bacterium]MDY6018295.1 oligosaccharide flippase family protein [Anaerococcus sp.]
MTSLKKNIIYNSTYQILLIILPIITSPYISRVLGAKNIGIFSYSQAFANYFYLVAMLGVKNYGNRTIAKVRDNDKELRINFWEIYFFQILFGIFVSLIYIFIVYFYIKVNKSVYYFQLFFILSGVFDLTWCYFGLEEFKSTTVISMFIKIIDVIAIFIFVRDVDDLKIYTFLICFAMIFNQIVLIPYILRKIPFLMPTIKGIKRHIIPNLILFIPVLAVSFYNIMDKLMLGIISTNTEVGFYTYAENITQIPNTLILSINNAVMPRMSNLAKKKDSGNSLKLINILMLLAMFISSGCAFGLLSISNTLIPWFYGKEFERCAIFVMLLSPIIIFKGWAGVLRTQYIIPNNKDRIFIISLFIGAIVNIVINFLLIPQFEGIGAIVGTFAAEFAVCFVQFKMVYKEIDVLKYLKDGIAFIVCGVLMSIVIILMGYLNINKIVNMFLQILFGGIIYTALSYIYIKKTREINKYINI